jgi:cell division protein FtsL
VSAIEVPMHSAAPALPQGLPREQRARARHLRVAEATRRRRRVRVAMWASALLTALALFVLVAFHVLAVQHAFAIDDLAEQRKVEELKYERLRTEVATLSSPESIVEAAKALGMIPASQVEYIDAPGAAPHSSAPDRTTSTLDGAHAEAKKSIGP